MKKLFCILFITTTIMAQNFWKTYDLYGGNYGSVAVKQYSYLNAETVCTGIFRLTNNIEDWGQTNNKILDYKQFVNITNVNELNSNFLLLEELRESYDQVHGWKNTSRYMYTYNENNRIYERLFQTWNPNIPGWVENQNSTYSYDANNNLVEMLIKKFDGSNWANYFLETNSYDLNNNQIGTVDKIWNGTDWENLIWFQYTYNINNCWVYHIVLDWNGSNWVNNQQHFWYVTENCKLEGGLVEFWVNEVWENGYLLTITYDGENRIESFRQKWDGQQWENFEKISYFYDINNNRTEEIYQYWQENEWANTTKYLYSYDEYSNRIERLVQTWQNSNWEDSYRINYSYIESFATVILNTDALVGSQVLDVTNISAFTEGDNIMINPGGLTQETNVVTGFGSLLLQEPLNFNHYAGEIIIIYLPVTVEDTNNEIIINYRLTQNYPNPFNPVTKISYALPNASMIDLKIYNILGQLITTLVNEEKPAGFYEVDFNAADLPSGVYMYRITAVPSGRQAGDPSTGSGQGFVETKKMLLLK